MAPEPAARGTAGLETASWLRRIGALAIDWVASTLVTVAIFGPSRYYHDSSLGFVPLVVFLVESAFGTALAGGSFGQLATRIRVIGLDGRPLSLFRALFRQLLVCLLLPPLIFQPDGRGLHDLWTKSAAYRLRTGRP